MPTIHPRFSILVPALWSRSHLLNELMPRLQDQARGKPVEILCVLDNKCRSIGLKRQACLDIARGDFVAFVDDDDSVFDTYVEDIVAAIDERPDASVIVFNQLTYIEGMRPLRVRFGLEYENEQARPTAEEEPELRVCHRKPWHVCAWRRDIAQRCVFPDASYGEDWWWAAQCCKLATSQHRIDKTLHVYRFSPGVTAAEHVFPVGDPPEPLSEPRSPHAPFPLG